MTVIGTGISWTHSTWNLSVGCTQVSAGCDHCYAMQLVNGPRGGQFGHRFEEVKLHPERLAHARRFKPMPDANGRPGPHMVFVNSMSDFWHDAIPDEFIHKALDEFEKHPTGIMQILTKRPVRARKILQARYGSKGMPAHFWIGVSAEDNRVAGRLNILRRIRDQCGGEATFFVSVEPIVGPTNELNFEGVDWCITGGESGPKARIMERAWLIDALAIASKTGVARWHKQSGQVLSHPNLFLTNPHATQRDRFRWLIDNGYELLPEEKGGATVDRATYRELPSGFHTLRAQMQGGLL